MPTSSGKQKISITVDSALLQNIDRLTENRSAVVEEGLRLWYQHHVEEQLRHFYQNQHQEDREMEEEWGEFAQSEMEQILGTEEH
ncbi:ribbon-helix-helix domain-containing protein (plasmid) [Synechocystis sp. B12]|jgi:Arc/MetJ-type ribon-helix-helix transcriptional regulator|nr:ribbon-helix-helix domain-containing protein [Synechocystis sp. B12]